MSYGTHGPKRITLSCALLLAPTMVLTACGDSSHPLAAKPYDAASQVAVSMGGNSSRAVDPDKPLEVTSKSGNGQITDVLAIDAAGRYVRGELSEDGSSWRSTSPLAAGQTYTVQISTENRSGKPGRRTVNFDTRKPDAKQLLKVKFGPDSGTYGVGQPITAELSKKIKGKAQRRIVERALQVRSTPSVKGAWHWVDGKKLHYRPKEYWPAHATITAKSRLAGVKIRDGLYGGRTKPLKLKTGDRIEAIADASALVMTVKKNGEVVNTMPITTGMAGYRTRNGTKVVLEKSSYVRMRSASVGISDFYDLPVYWATRLTWSGEYVHGAPWSAGSHGVANVSHGCTGASSSNARWFFNSIRPGDLVTHVNTDGSRMPAFGNGFGDWNMTWDKWRKGSALLEGTREGSTPADKARLRPRI
ncbi:L,D-transpeptidase [Streptomyces gobiensis]|uniref:L,D-transpeptidase n=1 Tax=Streptomyces gobiensis TaxID=2875706 RepID=UPI001E482C4F|nr:Ig-like domain-containing protein [Streptomyces gobiensis]UGY90936.1 Ig-like domain-containing protein [Streptomyces gobiensis]